MDEVSSFYKNIESWDGEFEQTTFVELLGRTVRKKGYISVQRPEKLRIEYEKPQAKVYLFNEGELYIYYPKEKAAQRYKNGKKLLGKEALNFLTGLSDMQKDFEITESSPKKLPLQFTKKAGQVLHLVAKSPTSNLSEIYLKVDSKTKHLLEALLQNESGNLTRYEFSNLKFNLNLSKALFKLPSDQQIQIKKGL